MKAKHQVRSKNRRTPLKKQARTRALNGPGPLPTSAAARGQSTRNGDRDNLNEIPSAVMEAGNRLEIVVLHVDALFEVMLERLVPLYAQWWGDEWAMGRGAALRTLVEHVMFDLAEHVSLILYRDRANLPGLKRYAEAAALLLYDYGEKVDGWSRKHAELSSRAGKNDASQKRAVLVADGLFGMAVDTADRLLAGVKELEQAHAGRAAGVNPS